MLSGGARLTPLAAARDSISLSISRVISLWRDSISISRAARSASRRASAAWSGLALGLGLGIGLVLGLGLGLGLGLVLGRGLGLGSGFKFGLGVGLGLAPGLVLGLGCSRRLARHELALAHAILTLALRDGSLPLRRGTWLGLWG